MTNELPPNTAVPMPTETPSATAAPISTESLLIFAASMSTLETELLLRKKVCIPMT